MTVIVRSTDVQALVRRIREHASGPAIRRELRKDLVEVTAPIREQMIATIPDALPKGGGLADLIHGATVGKVSVRSAGAVAIALRYTAPGHDVRTLIGKRLSHPVWGNSNVWVTQTAGVDPKVFPEKFDAQKPKIRLAVYKAINNIGRRVAQ